MADAAVPRPGRGTCCSTGVRSERVRPTARRGPVRSTPKASAVDLPVAGRSDRTGPATPLPGVANRARPMEGSGPAATTRRRPVAPGSRGPTMSTSIWTAAWAEMPVSAVEPADGTGPTGRAGRKGPRSTRDPGSVPATTPVGGRWSAQRRSRPAPKGCRPAANRARPYRAGLSRWPRPASGAAARTGRSAPVRGRAPGGRRSCFDRPAAAPRSAGLSHSGTP